MSRKENIIAAAAELFARKGYSGTSTAEIARQADVAHGTVFHHYKSKENLLLAICEDLVTDYIGGIRSVSEGVGTGWEALERVLRFSLVFRRERQDAIRVVFRDSHILQSQAGELRAHFRELTDQILEVKRRCIERGVEDHSIRDLPVRETAVLLHVLLNGMLHLEACGHLELPDLEEEMLDFCRRSLRAGTTSR